MGWVDPRCDDLPEVAAAVVTLFGELIDAALPGRLTGLYLVGSLALGDFRPGISDVDFVAVLDTPAVGSDLDALQRVHDAIDARADLPVLDGVYVTADAFEREPELANPAPHHVSGAFVRTGDGFELNPVTWATLSRHGVAARGPHAATLRIAVEDRVLAAWCLSNLSDYWSNYATSARSLLRDLDPDVELPAQLLAWAVTGPPRLHFTIATGHITTKECVAHWAGAIYDDQWRPLLDTALRARCGELATVTAGEAVAVPEFVEMVIAAASEQRRG